MSRPMGVLETAKRLSGNFNLVISPCTKRVKEKGKRTGKKEIYRQKGIILDVDNPDSHRRLTEEGALEIANKVIEEIKRRVGNDFGVAGIG